MTRAHAAARGAGRGLPGRACKAIWEGNQIVFESLPGLIAQIIENKTWRSYQHKDFASYALDATSNGLGVNTNQRLWILRCSMDVQGKHIKEWADVLAKVEEMVRVQAIEDGVTVRSFDGNSLEAMAKMSTDPSLVGRITYLPSKNKGNDGNILKLRSKFPDVYRKVVSGQVRIPDALREVGAGNARDNQGRVGRAQSLVRSMTPKGAPRVHCLDARRGLPRLDAQAHSRREAQAAGDAVMCWAFTSSTIASAALSAMSATLLLLYGGLTYDAP